MPMEAGPIEAGDLRLEQLTASAGRFELAGRTFSLVPADIWRRRKSALEDLQLRAAQAVGRIEFDGERLVVVVHRAREEATAPQPSAFEMLTRREFEVAMLVAQGKCDKEIARALGISGYTVREHLRRTSAKLGVSRRTAIVSIVLRSLGHGDVPAGGARRSPGAKAPAPAGAL